MAMNSPVQGSAADLIQKAMISIFQKIQADPEKADLKMLLQVHDELVFEAPAEKAAAYAEWVKSEMENAWPLRVPLVASAGIGKTWLEAH
jgi:DNA polymerase-1